MGAAAAKAVPQVRANAFKALPPSARRTESPEPGSDSMPSSDPPAPPSSDPPSDDSFTSESDPSVSAPASATTSSPTPVPAPAPPAANSTVAANTPPTGSETVPKVPGFRQGVTPDSKNPKAADYEPTVYALILRAAFEYEALISAINAFPGTTLRQKWAKKCWKNANVDAGEDYQMTDVISLLVCFFSLLTTITHPLLDS